MKLSNEQIQAILDGAPEGATQARARHELRGGVAYWQSPNGAEPINQAHAICSLREILELRREVERLKVERDEWKQNAIDLAINKEGSRKGDAAYERHFELQDKYGEQDDE